MSWAKHAQSAKWRLAHLSRANFTTRQTRRASMAFAGMSTAAAAYFCYGSTEHSYFSLGPLLKAGWSRMDQFTHNLFSHRQVHTAADPRFALPLTDEQVDRILKANEESNTIHTNSNPSESPKSMLKSPVVRFDTNAVKSNDPIEDYSSHHLLLSHTIKGLAHDGVLFGIFDGHGGPECGEIVSQHLSAYVAKSLAESRLAKGTITNESEKHSIITNAIKTAFKKLDQDILKGGFTLNRPDMNELQNMLRPAVAGSCALLAYIDGPDLYVACTGDSRALLGRRRADGSIETLALSEDQTVKNAHEYERMLDEHPGEIETLFVRGRVLGGLMPTRAFGDSRYKWPAHVSEQVLPALGSRRSIPYNYKTPPYVTAEPEVVHYRLNVPHAFTTKEGKPTVGDQFLVLATDGLYDELMNEEIGELMESYLKVNHSSHTKVEDFMKASKIKPKFVCQDGNAATHLIRNALIAGSRDQVGALMAIPPPYCRRYRDDMTVNVVFFGSSSDQSLPASSVDSLVQSTQLKRVDPALAREKPDRLSDMLKFKPQAKL